MLISFWILFLYIQTLHTLSTHRNWNHTRQAWNIKLRRRKKEARGWWELFIHQLCLVLKWLRLSTFSLTELGFDLDFKRILTVVHRIFIGKFFSLQNRGYIRSMQMKWLNLNVCNFIENKFVNELTCNSTDIIHFEKLNKKKKRNKKSFIS